MCQEMSQYPPIMTEVTAATTHHRYQGTLVLRTLRAGRAETRLAICVLVAIIKEIRLVEPIADWKTLKLKPRESKIAFQLVAAAFRSPESGHSLHRVRPRGRGKLPKVNYFRNYNMRLVSVTRTKVARPKQEVCCFCLSSGGLQDAGLCPEFEVELEFPH